MATSREELREHLVAALEASPELPSESREHLADVFLDELTSQYTLVPRGMAANYRAAPPADNPRRMPRRFGYPPAIWPLLFVLPFLLIGVSFAVHAPIFLFVLIFWVAMRFWRGPAWGPSRRRWG